MAAKWMHNPISQKLGAPVALTKPTAFAWEGDKTQHVVYVGTDGNVHELWFRKGGFNPQWQYGGALNVKANAPTATGTPSGFTWESDKTQHIVYRGSDSEIHELWFKHGMMGKAEWTYGGALNKKVGAPSAAGDPFGYTWDEDHSMHVIYRGVDNNIHEVWFTKGMTGGEWKYGGPINASVGAPPAVGEPAGFSWEHDKTQHIIYRAADNNIHELWFKHGMMGKAVWTHGGALNAMAGGPVAESDPMGFSWEADKTQHVIYRGQDNQTHELWFNKGMMGKGEWKYGGAISAKTGAPLADGMPWGFAWEGDHTMHIVYRGQDSNIHELWFSKGMTGGAWKYGAALNRMSDGPVAGSDPVGFAWEDDNSQHVVYRGQDNQIHELWFKK
jgi:hypothetical protein